MTTTVARPTTGPPAQPPAALAAPAPGWLAGRPGLVLLYLALVGCAAGLVAGLFSGPLWLDEALSVEIARLPVPEMFDALRQDGSPPLYYLLLHAWIELVGTGTVAVRLPTLALTVVALVLVHRLGGQLAGPVGARAAVIVLAALPWTMRFGSEARMYLLLVVLVLAGALALLRLHAGPSRPAVAVLAGCTGALLLTHYWALFLLLAVGALHLPGLLRRRPAAARVALGGVLGLVAFLPWVPTFLFQAAHTGAPWADPVGFAELLRTPQHWAGGPRPVRQFLGLVLAALAVVAAVRGPRQVRVLVGLTTATLVTAWVATAGFGGAYAPRYTAVVVPFVAVAVAAGALALRGRRLPMLALSLVTVVGIASGVPAAAEQRTSADEIAADFTSAAAPGDVLLYCPDQLGPPVARLLDDSYRQVVYPTLGPPELVDWVDYTERQDAADPVAVAAELDALAGSSAVFVVKAARYRTFGVQCEQLLLEMADRRGVETYVSGERGTVGELLFRFAGR